jgi:predicted permease
LLLALAAAGVVLLIACADVGGLMLARVTRRQREITIRAALGAGQGRIGRQLLVEGLSVALAGGAAGLWLAWIVEGALRQIFRVDAKGTIDFRVLGFALGASFVCAIILSLAPALHAAGLDLLTGLKQAALSSTETKRQRRLQSAIIVAQLTLAMALLNTAGLLTVSLVRLQKTELGFDPEHTLTFPVNLPTERYKQDRYAAFYDELLNNIRRLPGVQFAAAGGSVPLRSGLSRTVLSRVEGVEVKRRGIVYASATPGYFQTLGTRLEEGRDFTAHDTSGSAPVVILNRSAAKRYFGSKNPVGREVEPQMWNGAGSVTKSRTVIGVVADMKLGDMSSPAPPAIYWPVAQIPSDQSMFVVVRAQGDALALVGALREQVREADPDLPLYNVQPLTSTVAAQLSQPRSSAAMVAGFAVLALVLTGIGLWGLIDFATAQRTQEIGIRLALGSTRGGIVRGFVSQAAILGFIGILLGGAGALAGGRLLSELLFEVSATNIAVLSGAAAALFVVTMLAAAIPAVRATRVDPLVALRNE